MKGKHIGTTRDLRDSPTMVINYFLNWDDPPRRKKCTCNFQEEMQMVDIPASHLRFRGGVGHPKACLTSLAAPRFLSSAWCFGSFTHCGVRVGRLLKLCPARDLGKIPMSNKQTATTMQHAPLKI